MTEPLVSTEKASGGKDALPRSQGAVDWTDPSVPVGNSPPMSRWPLVLAIVAWGSWIGFLLLTVLSRGDAPGS